ncbi:MAG: ELM1/GtrOC1 family putative glycosyltransferase [Rickettsiaceae bacterium]|nr:ELM1/GtrOC1 family putative glycosyltransferase [Rickettsiaceae bacterium]
MKVLFFVLLLFLQININTLLQKYNHIKSKNWVLTDSKVGSNVQAISLAKELKLDYDVIPLEYSIFSYLPNSILPYGFLSVKQPDFRKIILKNKPQIVISASRKSALISASIKKLVPKAINIQILRPELAFSNFDLVVLPQHDTRVSKESKNVFRVIGSLCSIEQRIEECFDSFSKFCNNAVPDEYVAVLIGGNTKDFIYNEQEAESFFQTLLRISMANDLRMLITFSRRTPDILKHKINQLKSEWVKIYDPLSSDSNPYPGLLKKAKFVIVTSDSISMCSEVGSSGKPLYIYKPYDFKSRKHLTFIYQLQDLGIAKIIKNDTDILQEYHYTHLSESRRVSDYIISKILSVK